ncbi:MAG: cadmium-translocating P-type ATPase [Bacteroidetes bacterium]|nr:cadmium-translocating P-type ATPase [Bacteroidota bacterium]
MAKECCTKDHVHHQSEHESHEEHQHQHQHGNSPLSLFVPASISALILGIALVLDFHLKPLWWTGWVRLLAYILAYLPVGFPVMKEALKNMLKGEIFSEFFLMSIATIGAFVIGEFPEGVAVMLFYSVGEAFQEMAVAKAKFNIKTLLDQRPDVVNIRVDNLTKTVAAADVKIGQIIQLKPGEKLALDGELLTDTGSFNTAALTGESKPDTKKKGDIVLAGMINMSAVTEVLVTTEFRDSKLSKILELVQNATAEKAPTELFIRKFAKIYTPIVVALAIAITFLPYFFVGDYQLKTWLYRALIFLVISCPCALVISIPLGYFGGIGAGSRHGILFKGSHYLDVIAQIQNVVVDKTGTMTEGIFKVKEVAIKNDNKKFILNLLNTIESKSTHPIATAIHEYVGEISPDIQFDSIKEIPGYGLVGKIYNATLLVGNFGLLDQYGIAYNPYEKPDTVVAIAYNDQYQGYVSISDQIKTQAQPTVEVLNNMNITTTMLSGDKRAVVKEVAQQIGIKNYFGDLLPEDKVNQVKRIKARNESVAFVGDGVNDAPVLAMSDVGIAMGGLGSDAAIETANIVIQDDNPYKIPMAIKIGRATKKIVTQNIILAFGVKAIVLFLGAGGIATMWEAVFADVGVALLAILNAIRIQKMNFS